METALSCDRRLGSDIRNFFHCFWGQAAQRGGGAPIPGGALDLELGDVV